MKKYAALFLVVIAWNASLYASGEFTSLGAGGRSVGMGRAYTALAEDASAIYWNPAGLSALKYTDISSFYTSPRRDTSYGFTGIALPTKDSGNFGTGVAYLNTRDTRFINERYDTAGNSGVASEFMAVFSYARNISRFWLGGANVKFIRQSVYNKSESGLGIDLGGIYNAGDRLKLGLNVRNIIQPAIRQKTRDTFYPVDITLGCGYRLLPADTWTLSLDVNKTPSRDVKFLIGNEFTLWKYLNLRAGFSDTDLNAGLGFRIYTPFGLLGIDYVYARSNDAASSVYPDTFHGAGFNLRFGERMSVEASLPENESELYEVMRIATEKMKKIRGDAELLVPGITQPFKAEKTDEPQQDMKDVIRELIRKYSGMAHESFNKGEFTESIQHWKVVLNLDPENIDAFSYIDAANKNIEQLGKEKLVNIKQKKIDNLLNQARYYEIKGEMREEFNVWQNILALDPENIEIKNKIRDKISKLKTRIRELTETRYAEGLKKYQNGDLQGAIWEWEIVLKLNPAHLPARNAMEKAKAELALKVR
ncbi:MAG: PorV/PorQ family protein [Elusimicrobiota bacterium]